MSRSRRAWCRSVGGKVPGAGVLIDLFPYKEGEK